MLRTLIVTNDFPPKVGGVERFIFALAERMPPASVHVLAPAHEGSELFDRALAFRVERLPMGRMLPSRRLRKRIREVLENERPDVVLFGHALPLGLAGPAIAKKGVPYVVLTHGLEYWLAKIPGLANLFRRIAASAAGVFAISDYTARGIGRVMPEQMEVAILSPGVDTTRFRPDVDGPRVRAELDAGSSPIVLCVGRLVHRKGMTSSSKHSRQSDEGSQEPSSCSSVTVPIAGDLSVWHAVCRRAPYGSPARSRTRIFPRSTPPPMSSPHRAGRGGSASRSRDSASCSWKHLPQARRSWQAALEERPRR